jgi:hypothetical protein
MGVVVEVDGLSHFLRVGTDTSTLATNGSTRLKRRLLEVTGWRVVHVPTSDWESTTLLGSPLRLLSPHMVA